MKYHIQITRLKKKNGHNPCWGAATLTCPSIPFQTKKSKVMHRLKEKEMRRAWAELAYPNKFIPSPC
jgi:hypothetical protein